MNVIRIIKLFTSENFWDNLNLSSTLNLFFSCSSSLYLMSSSLWSTSSMLSSFMIAAAAASLSFVGDLRSALVGDLRSDFGVSLVSSGLAFFGLPINVIELRAPGDDGEVP